MTVLRWTLPLVVACAHACMAAVGWPAELAEPVPGEKGDSGTSEIVSEFKDVIIKGKNSPEPGDRKNEVTTFRTGERFTLRRNTEQRFVSQTVGYDFSTDNNVGIQAQYLDLSGVAVQKAFPFSIVSTGLEWAPLLYINRDRNKSNARGNLHLGPVADMVFGSVPVQLRGGGVADLWHDNLPRHVFDYGWDDFTTRTQDLGLYAGLRVGDADRRLFSSVPVYAAGSAYARELDSANVAATAVNGLFLNEMPTGDSIFIFVADSVLTGRSATISGRAGGPMQYSTTPLRVQHSLQGMAGFKGISRFHLAPSLLYDYSLYSIAYPSLIGDDRRSVHSLSAMLVSDEDFVFEYAGGIRFDFQNEDWVYKSDIAINQTGGLNDNVDTLIENLKDNEGFYVEMEHVVRKYTGSGFGGQYAFNISRDQKTYPNYYVSMLNDTVRNIDDRDRVNQHHNVDLTVFSTEPFKITMGGEFIKNITSYVRREKSAYNQTERIYRLTAALIVKPLEVLSFQETVGADAKLTKYHFPQFNTTNPPPYSRRVYSRFGGQWRIRPAWSIDGFWEETYSDVGFWEGSEYRDNTTPDISGDYYAIVSKTLDSRLEIAAALLFQQSARIRVGSLFQDIYYLTYDEKAFRYRVESSNQGYAMTPFVEVQAQLWERLVVALDIKRYIDTVADDEWKIASYIHLEF